MPLLAATDRRRLLAIGVADDSDLGVGISLQTAGNVVQDGLAVLSTRHGRFKSGNWIELILVQTGFAGTVSTVTVAVQVPVRPGERESVAVTVT